MNASIGIFTYEPFDSHIAGIFQQKNGQFFLIIKVGNL